MYWPVGFKKEMNITTKQEEVGYLPGEISHLEYAISGGEI
jgi:hypothetical protein